MLRAEDNPDDEFLIIGVLKKRRLANALTVTYGSEKALGFLFTEGRYAKCNPGGLPMVVLLDLKPPDIGGIELLQAIRGDERTATLPPVMPTLSDEEADMIESDRPGANSCVRTPVEFDRFQEAARTLHPPWMLPDDPPAGG